MLITAGPTYESIDPVRYIGNYSSGQMGFAIAEEFARRGAMVKLISGPVNLEVSNKNIQLINVTSAEEMNNACKSVFPKSQIAIMAAAVADFTPEIKKDQKIKKEKDGLLIRLKKTQDILAGLGQSKKNHQLLVGFALETDDALSNAKKKLKNKNLDLIVLNTLQDKGAGFGFKTNKVTLIDKNGQVDSCELKLKTEVAVDIAEKIKSLYFIVKSI